MWGTKSRLSWCVFAGLLIPGVLLAADTGKQTEDEYRKLNLKVSQDKFKGTATVTVPPYEKLPGLGLLNSVRFYPVYVVLSDGDGTYGIGISANLYEWAFLDGSIDMLIDGERVHIPALSTPNREVLSAHSLYESFSVMVSEDLIRRISHAYLVEIRLNGSRTDVEGQLRPKHIAQFRKILEAPEAVGVGPKSKTTEPLQVLPADSTDTDTLQVSPGDAVGLR